MSNELRPLTEIARGYDTDKVINRYTDLYQVYFGNLRERAQSMLEIGVLHGESLRMWREYFPSASIHGLDINPDTPRDLGEGISVSIGDQADPAVLLSIVEAAGGIDVVVDDACHQVAKYRVSFETLFPIMRPAGWYVIEDIRHDRCEAYYDFLRYLDDGVHGVGVLTPTQASVWYYSVHRDIIFIRRR